MELIYCLTITAVTGLLLSPCASLECGPISEGSDKHLLSGMECPPSAVVEWEFGDPLTELCTCNPSCPGSCFNLGPALLNVQRECLYINVSRPLVPDLETRISWTCRDNVSVTTFCCDLIIYYRPEVPSCEYTLTDNEKTLTLTCSTSRVYPQALCHFQWRQTDVDPPGDWSNISSSVVYEHPTVPGPGPIYFRSECTITVALSSFPPGQLEFEVSMFPDVPGGSQSATNTSITVKCPPEPPGDSDNDVDIAVVVGAALAGVYIIIMMVIIILVLSKRGKEKDRESASSDNGLSIQDLPAYYGNVLPPGLYEDETICPRHYENDGGSSETASGSMTSESYANVLDSPDMNNEQLSAESCPTSDGRVRSGLYNYIICSWGQPE